MDAGDMFQMTKEITAEERRNEHKPHKIDLNLSNDYSIKTEIASVTKAANILQKCNGTTCKGYGWVKNIPLRQQRDQRQRL